jgi:hypothetical protein
MVTTVDAGWSLSAARELLPHPRTEFAKFVIAPQPNGMSAAGIRDTTDANRQLRTSCRRPSSACQRREVPAPRLHVPR